MDYDEKKIKTVTRIINGQEVQVKIVPPGMHGKEWKPNPYDNSYAEEEDQEIQRITKDLVETSIETIDDEDEPVITSYDIEE